MNRQVLISPNDVVEWFNNNSIDTISLDTETTSLDYSTLKIEGLSIYNGKNVCYIDLDNNQFKAEILQFLRYKFKENKLLIAHNIKFDLKVLHKYNINFTNSEYFCTMVASHLIDENGRHGLKHLSKTILGHNTISYNDVATKKKTSDFYEYAMNDAVWCWELAQIQKHKLQDFNMIYLFRDIEMPFQDALVEMETTGVLVDSNKLKVSEQELISLVRKLTQEMLEELKEPYELQYNLFNNTKSIVSKINFNSSAQLASIVFDKLGLEVVEYTKKTKTPSVGAKTVAKYKDTNKFIGLLYKYKIAYKLLSSFFTPLQEKVDKDGRIRPNFNDIGTATGRLSSSKPNLQQLSKPIEGFPNLRSCFIVPKGYKMITCDYSGQELRVLTEISKEPKLIEVFNQGKDLHLSTANDFFNLNIPDEILYSTHPEHNTYKTKYKAQRNKAKTINFGIAYGKGAYGFSNDFGISEEEAQEILDNYFGAYPNVKGAINNCHTQVRKEGQVSTMTGRTRHFKQITLPNGNSFYTKKDFRRAFNFLIQGYSADMIRLAAIKVMTIRQPEWKLKMIMTIHDEIVYQVKEQYADIASKEIKKAFENVVKFSIPIVADVSIGNNYYEAK